MGTGRGRQQGDPRREGARVLQGSLGEERAGSHFLHPSFIATAQLREVLFCHWSVWTEPGSVGLPAPHLVLSFLWVSPVLGSLTSLLVLLSDTVQVSVLSNVVPKQ